MGNLDYAEGGHYSTNVFVGDGDDLIRLHEEFVDLQAASFSFDSTTMVVALKKEVNDENAIEEDNKWPNSGSRKESNYLSSPQLCENTRGQSSDRVRVVDPLVVRRSENGDTKKNRTGPSYNRVVAN